MKQQTRRSVQTGKKNATEVSGGDDANDMSGRLALPAGSGQRSANFADNPTPE